MIVFLGIVGSGKSTQAALLSVRLACLRLSTGDLLRANMKGRIAKKMLAGELVEDKNLFKLLDKDLKRHGKTEFILDGFPRTMKQAEWLVDKIKQYKIKLTAVVHLNASHKTVKKRLLARGRPDDYEGAIAERFAEYESKIVPILDYLREQSLPVYEIDGEKPEQEVERNIEKTLSLSPK